MSKTPTIRDVAKQAGVSPITVSRVVNNAGYVRPETRARVEAAIEELHYIPNALSQSLRFKKTNTVALVVSDITNPFWTTVARGVEDACSEHGLHVILCNTDEKLDKQENYLNLLLQRQVDGILLTPTQGSTAKIVRKIQKQHVPFILLDRAIADVEVDLVRSDSEGGAYQIVEHLISLGHRKIGILSGSSAIPTSQQRVAGYRRALQAYGLPIDESLILFGEFTQASGYEMTHHFMQRSQPTALFAANNFIAIGMLSALNELGLRIPQDISVVGFDDLHPTLMLKPFLTVVTQTAHEVGFQAAKLLIERINGQSAYREIVLPVHMIIRSSTRAVIRPLLPKT